VRLHRLIACEGIVHRLNVKALIPAKASLACEGIA